MANTKITGTRPIKDPALAREVDREMEAARKRREARERPIAGSDPLFDVL